MLLKPRRRRCWQRRTSGRCMRGVRVICGTARAVCRLWRCGVLPALPRRPRTTIRHPRRAASFSTMRHRGNHCSSSDISQSRAHATASGCGGVPSPEELHRTLHSPSVAYSSNLKRTVYTGAAANKAVSGGRAPGHLLLPPSMRAVADPGSNLEKGAARPPGRLPTVGPSPTGATVSPALLSSPNDSGMIGSHCDQSHVSGARRRTVSTICESSSARSRRSIIQQRERQGGVWDDRHRRPCHRDRLLTRPGAAAPRGYSSDVGVEASQGRSSARVRTSDSACFTRCESAG